MIQQYDNTNRGVLFKNDKKDSDKHPDYTGKINVDGKNLRLSAWIKQGKNGKFMALQVSSIDERPVPRAARNDIDVDEDIPF